MVMSYFVLFLSATGFAAIQGKVICETTDSTVGNINCTTFDVTNLNMTVKYDDSINIINIEVNSSNIGVVSQSGCCLFTNSPCNFSNTYNLQATLKCSSSSNSFTLSVSQVSDDLHFKFLFVEKGENATSSVFIQDCDGYCNRQLGCIHGAKYNNTSDFTCEHNTTLFVDGNPQNNFPMTCDISSSWVGQGNPECWFASLQNLQPSYNESDNVDLQCSLEGNSTKPQISAMYFKNGQPVDNNFQLDSSYNGETMWCSITVAGTQLESNTTILIVQYKPKSVSVAVPFNSNIAELSDRFLLHWPETLSIKCENSANPNATCSWVYLNQTHESVIYDTCNTDIHVSNLSAVLCSASNLLGATNSSANTFTVTGKRTAFINHQQNSVELILGDSVNLQCSIAYQDELNTIFQWVVPNKQRTEFYQSNLRISETTKADRGNYTCTTNDAFDVGEANVYVDVLWNASSVTVNTTTSGISTNTKSQIFLQRDQNVTVNCYPDDANPKPICFIQINESVISTDGISCSKTIYLNKTSTAKCIASNKVGNTSSPTMDIVVLYDRNSSVETSSQPSESIRNGNDISMSCIIPYYQELDTQFTWTIPYQRNVDLNSPNLFLSNLTRFHLGDYICRTQDVFGSYTNKLFLNVTYPPQETDSYTRCNWTDVTTGNCFVTFASNPLTQNYFLSRDGSEDKFICNSCQFQSDSNDATLQTFYLNLGDQQSKNNSGGDEKIKMTIMSSSFPDENLEITFIISNNPLGNQISNQTALIVGISVVGAILFVVILVASFLFLRKRRLLKSSVPTIRNERNGNMQSPSNEDEAVASSQDEYATVDFKQKTTKNSVKEEKVNPLYGDFSDPDAIQNAFADKTESAEKEDRVNPLYSPVQESAESGDVYAQVNLAKKTKNEKEEKQNPLYGSYPVLKSDLHSISLSSTSEKEEKLNPLYSESYQTSALNGDTYAQVDKPKKRATEVSSENISKKKPPKPPIRKKPILKPENPPNM